MSNKEKEVTLEQINIITKIPKNTIQLKITATIFENGEEVKVKKKLEHEDIIAARHDFLDNVEFGDDYDAKFVITDEGRKYLEDLMKGELKND